MNSLTIYSDPPFGPAAMELLKTGVGPHKLVFPEQMADSVLGRSVEGPEFATAEVALGQPDVDCVLAAENLRCA